MNALSDCRLDRASHLRSDEERLRALREAETSRYLLTHGDDHLVGEDGLPFFGIAAVQDLELADHPIFLGSDGNEAWFAARVLDRPDEPMKRSSFRSLVASTDPVTASRLAYARGLLLWHWTHPRCSQCGERTRSAEGGHIRICEHCEAKHFPRTDPAVIVLVEAGDACLLGRQRAWPPGRFSTLAGFVEPGETLEDAVRREVEEEAGISVREVSYHSSQPWPLPSSLMLGFVATAERKEPEPRDGELEEVRWFTREELTAAERTGAVILSPEYSISRALIESWRARGAR